MRRHMMKCASLLGAAGLVLTAVPALAEQAPDQAGNRPEHHSVVKGAIVGGVAGRAAHHHTKTGAVGGALIQHHRNKKAEKAAQKGQ